MTGTTRCFKCRSSGGSVIAEALRGFKCSSGSVCSGSGGGGGGGTGDGGIRTRATRHYQTTTPPPYLNYRTIGARSDGQARRRCGVYTQPHYQTTTLPQYYTIKLPHYRTIKLTYAHLAGCSVWNIPISTAKTRNTTGGLARLILLFQGPRRRPHPSCPPGQRIQARNTTRRRGRRAIPAASAPCDCAVSFRQPCATRRMGARSAGRLAWAGQVRAATKHRQLRRRHTGGSGRRGGNREAPQYGAIHPDPRGVAVTGCARTNSAAPGNGQETKRHRLHGRKQS